MEFLLISEIKNTLGFAVDFSDYCLRESGVHFVRSDIIQLFYFLQYNDLLSLRMIYWPPQCRWRPMLIISKC